MIKIVKAHKGLSSWGVFRTGDDGKAIATKLVELGYEVKMGSRTITNDNAQEWVKNNGKDANAGTVADAAHFGEIVFNCTKGDAALSIFQQIELDKFAPQKVVPFISIQ